MSRDYEFTGFVTNDATGTIYGKHSDGTYTLLPETLWKTIQAQDPNASAKLQHVKNLDHPRLTETPAPVPQSQW